MKKIISIFRQLIHDKRGKKGIFIESELFYRATKPKHKKFEMWLNIERIILHQLLTRKLGYQCRDIKVEGVDINKIIDSIPENKLEEHYYEREERYKKELDNALKKGYVTNVLMFL